MSPEEEYKRLSEALADEGTYNAVAFKYSADYYDPSQPTEEEEAARETGETTPTLSHTRIHMHTHTQQKLLMVVEKVSWNLFASKSSLRAFSLPSAHSDVAPPPDGKDGGRSG